MWAKFFPKLDLPSDFSIFHKSNGTYHKMILDLDQPEYSVLIIQSSPESTLRAPTPEPCHCFAIIFLSLRFNLFFPLSIPFSPSCLRNSFLLTFVTVSPLSNNQQK